LRQALSRARQKCPDGLKYGGKIMGKTLPFLRKGLLFTAGHLVLLAVIVIWLLLQSLPFSNKSVEALATDGRLLAYLFPAFLMDNYLSCCVYSALKDFSFHQFLPWTGCWRQGLAFFAPVLFFKVALGMAGLFLAAMASTTLTAIASTNLLTAAAFFVLALVWLSVGAYFLLATFLAPLIIIAENKPVFQAMLTSINLVRHHLASLVVLLGILAVPWGFVIVVPRLYNSQTATALTDNIARAAALGFLEIVTIQTLYAFLAEVTGQPKD